jgi:minor histocompatibility antigen H13
MSSVATNLDGPIELVWPKSAFSSGRDWSKLSLGDVILPGTFIALALRYDYHRYSNSTQGARFGKPYFHATLTTYTIGLSVAMHWFNKAQAALLCLR